MRRVLLVLAIAGLFADGAFGADEVKATGKIEAVTLYRGQALVTRTVAFDAPPGAVQLVVTDLPDRVMPQSLHASTGDGLRVRAVRFRATARKEAPKAEVRELDKTIRGIELKLRQNASDKRLANQLEADLNSLRNFVVPSAKVEMAKGVLNVDTLQKVTDMMSKRRTDLTKTKLELAENARTLREELALIVRKRAELTRSRSKTAREAVVFLDKAAAGKGQMRLSYLVSDATWEPVYNLRVAGEKTKVNVEYTAIARQMTGEDWTDVKLTLSAAVAQMVADGPALAPLRVRLTKTREQLNRAQVEAQLKQSQGMLQALNMANTRFQGQSDQMDLNWKMNQSSWAYQGIELAASAGYVSLIQDAGGIGRTASLSANYKLESRVTFASRRENQTIEIARFDLPTEFHYEAVPLLTEYVFRYAQLTNNSKLALLQGKSTTYLDGSFVGIGTVPMMARGQQATVGFGMDPQLRATREFVSKKESDE